MAEQLVLKRRRKETRRQETRRSTPTTWACGCGNTCCEKCLKSDHRCRSCTVCGGILTITGLKHQWPTLPALSASPPSPRPMLACWTPMRRTRTTETTLGVRRTLLEPAQLCTLGRRSFAPQPWQHPLAEAGGPRDSAWRLPAWRLPREKKEEEHLQALPGNCKQSCQGIGRYAMLAFLLRRDPFWVPYTLPLERFLKKGPVKKKGPRGKLHFPYTPLPKKAVLRAILP